MTARKMLLLLAACSLPLMPTTAVAQPACQTPDAIERLNEGVLEKKIAHVKGEHAIVFILLDPIWSLPDFEDVPYRVEEDMENIRTGFDRLVREGVDEVVVWRFRMPGLGAVLPFRAGCAVQGYGEPDMIEKIAAMNDAFKRITRLGPDDPSVRESIRRVLQQTPYEPDDGKIDIILNKIRPFVNK
jgi:hypothetical protein